MALQYSLILGSTISPNLFFFSNITLAVWDLSWFHIHFLNTCSSSAKQAMGICIGIAQTLKIALGHVDGHFNDGKNQSTVVTGTTSYRFQVEAVHVIQLLELKLLWKLYTFETWPLLKNFQTFFSYKPPDKMSIQALKVIDHFCVVLFGRHELRSLRLRI